MNIVCSSCFLRDGKASTRTEILHNIDPLSPLQGSRLYNDTFDTRVRAAIRVGDYKLLTGDPGKNCANYNDIQYIIMD